MKRKKKKKRDRKWWNFTGETWSVLFHWDVRCSLHIYKDNSSSLRFIRQLFCESLSGLRLPTSWTEVNYTRLGIPEDSQLLQMYLALGKHDLWQSSPTLPPSECYQTVWEGSQEDCSLQKPPYSSTWDGDNTESPTSRFHRAEMILEKMQNPIEWRCETGAVHHSRVEWKSGLVYP